MSTPGSGRPGAEWGRGRPRDLGADLGLSWGEGHLPRRTADKLAVPRRGEPPCRVTWVTSQMTWERTSPGASASLVVLEMV